MKEDQDKTAKQLTKARRKKASIEEKREYVGTCMIHSLRKNNLI